MKNIKEIIFIIVIILVFILLAEFLSSIIVGDRLIPEIREDGFYYFKPNQEGWYSHLLSMPHARINNIGARGEDVDADLLNNQNYVFLGDSFTFGWAVEEDETIPYYFMKEDDNVVLNYGMGGYGVDHIIMMYEFRSGLFKEEDVIILMIIEDDFYREVGLHQKSPLRNLFWVIREKSSLVSWIWENAKHIKGGFSKEEIPIGEKGNVFEDYGDKLLNLNKDIEERGINLVYVFYEYNYTDYSSNAEEFCFENNLNCITDIPEVIDSIEGDIYSIDRGHPSAELNEEVAKRITKFINNNF